MNEVTKSFIGGSQAGLGNVISGNNGDGVTIGNPLFPDDQSHLNIIQNNWIGFGNDGTTKLPNKGWGINFIGAKVTENANKGNKFVVGGNGLGNVNDPNKKNKTFDPNSLTGTGYGIYTGSQSDSPVLTSAVVSGSSITIQGTLASTPSAAFFLEFFGNQQAAVPGYEQGEEFLGMTTVSTDANGDASFNVTFNTVFGSYVSATATGAAVDGYTSQFSTYLPTLLGSSTTVTASSNPVLLGQSVTFTATVAAGPGAGSSLPTGSVTFRDGSTDLGTVSLNAATGLATLSTSGLSVGNHTITALYSGDANFATSSGNTLLDVVLPFGTAVQLTSSQNPAVLNQAVTFTAAVLSPSGSPTGTVDFLDGTTVLGTALLDSITGLATLSTSGLSSGSHMITATYSGDSSFSPATSANLVQQVALPGATVQLSSNANPSIVNQSVTFTAAVSGPPGIPTGTVTFLDNGALLGTATLNASGQATLSSTTLLVGIHAITVTYSGDTNYSPSISDNLLQVVGSPSATIGLTSSQNPSTALQSVTFTATLSSPLGTPTGSVTFADNGIDLGTVSLDANGQATFSTATLAAGQHLITASYSGDSSFSPGSSDVLVQEVTGLLPTVQLTSSQNPAAGGQPVTLTATVSSPGGTPTGYAIFWDGYDFLGFDTLDALGTATLTTSTLTPGTHSLQVSYSGDAVFVPAESTLSQEVGQLTPGIALTSSQNPSLANQAVPLTVVVTAPAGSTLVPTGSVTFLDGGIGMGSGTLDSNGAATFTTAPLSVGPHDFTAIYMGDTNFASVLSDHLAQQANQLTPTGVLTSSQNPSVAGQAVIFTVVVTAPPGSLTTPTGTVTFYDAGGFLGSGGLDGSGTATLTTSSLGTGTHEITVVYSGDMLFVSATSNTLSQQVDPPAFSVVLTSDQNPAVAWQPVTFTVVVTAPPGSLTPPSGSVTFYDGGVFLGTGFLDMTGTVTLTTSSLGAGTHDITADFWDDMTLAFWTSNHLFQEVT